VRFEVNRMLFLPISDWYVGLGFCYLSLSHFFYLHFGMSACRLKCSKPMGPNSDVVQ